MKKCRAYIWISILTLCNCGLSSKTNDEVARILIGKWHGDNCFDSIETTIPLVQTLCKTDSIEFFVDSTGTTKSYQKKIDLKNSNGIVVQKYIERGNWSVTVKSLFAEESIDFYFTYSCLMDTDGTIITSRDDPPFTSSYGSGYRLDGNDLILYEGSDNRYKKE